jgi:hypothetical protein
MPEKSDPVVICTVCHRPKAPRGRSVPAVLASDYCTDAPPQCPDHCPGYEQKPLSSPFWPGERDELEAERTTDQTWPVIPADDLPSLISKCHRFLLDHDAELAVLHSHVMVSQQLEKARETLKACLEAIASLPADALGGNKKRMQFTAKDGKVTILTWSARDMLLNDIAEVL